MPFPYEINLTTQETQRGVYFGELATNTKEVIYQKDAPIFIDTTVNERFDEWKSRWLKNRIEFIKTQKYENH